MSNGPKISIITACYNAERTIEQTIQSVINQTYDNIEYIIVDGASTDGTMEIVKKYEEQIDIIISEPDEGIYDAFNKGVKASTGDFINFMNADDYFSSYSILQEVAGYLYKDPNILMLHGDVKAFDEVTGHWHYRGEPLTYKDFENGKMCPHQSVFTHRKLFQEFRYFDLKYKILADIDFTIKCFKKYEDVIEYFPKEIASFRLGGLSNALSYEKKMHLENSIIHLEHFGNIPSHTKEILDNFDTYNINQYYHHWLEVLTMDNILLENKLFFLKKEVVAIFGTKKNATYLYHTFRKVGINIVNFIDNDTRMQQKKFHNHIIASPQIIKEQNITCVIISIERESVAKFIEDQLKSIKEDLLILNWKYLFD